MDHMFKFKAETTAGGFVKVPNPSKSKEERGLFQGKKNPTLFNSYVWICYYDMLHCVKKAMVLTSLHDFMCFYRMKCCPSFHLIMFLILINIFYFKATLKHVLRKNLKS
ncbi:hypothetical protein Pint_04534 [Pistacia integerrima]|uniref:Uncharacterized protein n=1 Tax=Pistacia integerrima TaxID=434235 RepID=A0ACC0YZK8_9ROSI|nr:hypothetical protein Pint_04534 [Pistacia integerrima]